MSRRPRLPRRPWPAAVAWVTVVAAGVVTTAAFGNSLLGAVACGGCASLASAIALAGVRGPAQAPLLTPRSATEIAETTDPAEASGAVDAPVPSVTSPTGSAGWYPGGRQCGACGSFSITGPDDAGEGAPPVECSCERCGTTWTATPGEPWPDIRIRPAVPTEET